MPRYDPTADPTASDEEPDERPTMSDVSHTPPHETSANTVWGRGPETVTDDLTPAEANGDGRAPADD